jgi:hypothetical protein
VVLTAELTGVVARLAMPIERDPGDDLRVTPLLAVVGGGVFGAVVLIAALPGPSGLAATALAAGACVALAVRMAER